MSENKVKVNDNGTYVDQNDGLTYGTITYGSYLGYESEPSRPFIMIAELIDNSISSFENSLRNWNKSKKLSITIEFDFASEIEVESKWNNEKKYLEGTSIKYTDNAFGFRKEDDLSMGIDDALKSLIVYGQKNRGISDKNKYGKGLKHCVYYFGQDLEIITSNGVKTARLKRTFTQDGIDEKTRYPYDAELIDPIPQGTTIIISNIYKKKTFEKDAFNNLMKSLASRYVNYIEEGLVEIKYSIKTPKYFKENKQADKFVEPVRDLNKTNNGSNEPSVIDNLSITKNYNDFFEKLELEYDRRYKLFSTKKYIESNERVDLAIFEKTYNLVKRKMESLIDEKPEIAELKSSIDLELKNLSTEKNVMVPFDFWVLPLSENRNYAGIRFFEGKRGIRHVCEDKDLKPWNGHILKSDDANRTPKKFAGSIDLSLISAETVKDKSGFFLPHSSESDLSTKIWSVYSAVAIFIIQIAKTDKTNLIEVETPSITNELKKSIEDSFNKSEDPLVGELKVDDDKTTMEFTKVIKDRQWTIGIKIDSETTGNHKTISAFEQDDKKILIVIYYRNQLWQKIRENFGTPDSFMKDLFRFRIVTLVEHSIAILRKLEIKEELWTTRVVDVLEELGEDYIGQNISTKK